jgi:hypothetical protein
MDNRQLLEAAFVNKSVHTELGELMAQHLYAEMQRPGFMRTLMFHQSNHTVSEFTERELVLAKRVRRHHGINSRLTNRFIIRQLRNIN